MLNLLSGPAVTSVHDYWKNQEWFLAHRNRSRNISSYHNSKCLLAQLISKWNLLYTLLLSIPRTCSDNYSNKLRLPCPGTITWSFHMWPQLMLCSRFFGVFISQMRLRENKHLILNPSLPNSWASLLKYFGWSCHHRRKIRCFLVPSYSRLFSTDLRAPGLLPGGLLTTSVCTSGGMILRITRRPKKKFDSHLYVFSLS